MGQGTSAKELYLPGADLSREAVRPRSCPPAGSSRGRAFSGGTGGCREPHARAAHARPPAPARGTAVSGRASRAGSRMPKRMRTLDRRIASYSPNVTATEPARRSGHGEHAKKGEPRAAPGGVGERIPHRAGEDPEGRQAEPEWQEACLSNGLRAGPARPLQRQGRPAERGAVKARSVPTPPARRAAASATP
jgi:hypothetical protein